MPHANSLANLRVGGGRPPGVPNKLNISIKTMVERALSKAGGVDYLVRQAETNPVAFMGLVGRVLPLQLQSADGDGNPIVLHLIAARGISDEIQTSIQQRTPQTIEHSPAPQGDLLDQPLPEE